MKCSFFVSSQNFAIEITTIMPSIKRELDAEDDPLVITIRIEILNN